MKAYGLRWLFKSDTALLNVFRPFQVIHIYEVLWVLFVSLFCSQGEDVCLFSKCWGLPPPLNISLYEYKIPMSSSLGLSDCSFLFYSRRKRQYNCWCKQKQIKQICKSSLAQNNAVYLKSVRLYQFILPENLVFIEGEFTESNSWVNQSEGVIFFFY